MRSVTNACRVIALLIIVLLSACKGGGSSGNEQSSTSVSLNNIAFNVASPDSPTPSSQTFSATVSPGTLYVVILHNGAAIINTSYTLSGTTAQIVVTPPSPNSLGAGVFRGTITATGYTCSDPACSGVTAGNSQIVNVTYTIPPIVRFVAPYVGVDSTAGSVVIRGQGFEQFTVQNVMFGTTAGAFTVVSDTEIQASYPATLTAGATSTAYPVTIQAPSCPGPIKSLANLVVVHPPIIASPMTVPYSSATPTVKELVYDAERQALLVAVDTLGGGEILRYPYSGGGSWGAVQTSPVIPTLSDIALSTDGKQLLALSQSALNLIDPAAITTQPTVLPTPTLATGTTFTNIAVGNDGNAVVTTGNPPGTSASLYLYNACNPNNDPTVSPCLPAFPQTPSAFALDNSTAVASTDGSLIALIQKDSTLASPPSVYQYTAASDTFSGTNVVLNQDSVNPVAPALVVYNPPPNTTTGATRIVLSGKDSTGATVTNVYDASYNLLGMLPSTTLAAVVKTDATGTFTAYTYDDSTVSQVLSFNITTSQAGGLFSSVSATTTANPGTGVKMAISADGGTLFLAGSTQIVVLPAP